YFMRTGGHQDRWSPQPGTYGRIDLSDFRLATGENLLPAATNDPDVPNDTSQLRTPLPYTVAPGASLDIHVAFCTKLPPVTSRTGYAGDFVFAAQWFPKLAVLERDGQWAHFPYHYQAEFYADFGTYDVTLTVPASDIVGATGLEDGPPI